MKKRNIFFTLILICAGLPVFAQTADEIINKHLDAIGGKSKLSGIHSVIMENTMQVMGSDAPSKTTIVNAKGYRVESEMGGQTMVQALSEKGGWMINPLMGSGSPEPMPESVAKQAVDQLYIIPLLDYQEKGFKAELLGKEKVGESDAYKIRLISKENAETFFFIDAASFYLVRLQRSAEMMGQTVDNIATYSDFKKTDYGWVVPYSTDLNIGGQFSIASTLKNIQINPVVDVSIFEMKK